MFRQTEMLALALCYAEPRPQGTMSVGGPTASLICNSPVPLVFKGSVPLEIYLNLHNKFV